MIREIHEICALTSLVFGSAFNIGLVWLILKHTPTELRVYSRILLQTCVTDLLMLVLDAIVQPVNLNFSFKTYFCNLQNNYRK